jgi:hypothetical protein
MDSKVVLVVVLVLVLVIALTRLLLTIIWKGLDSRFMAVAVAVAKVSVLL